MASSALRVAALGVGRLGRIHAENLARFVPDVALALIVDHNEATGRSVAEALGVPFSTDPDAAFADPSIQAVEICTASDSHADLIVAAAQAGKAIFCEKPIALSLADADRALDAVARAGVPLQMGFMRRYDAAYREANRLIEAGTIGRALTFRSASLDGSISSSRAFLERRGGIFVDVALHDFDLARWLMRDEVVEVHAIGAALVHGPLREVGDVDNAFVTLRFASGALGCIQVSHTAVHGYDIATEVIGEAGSVRAGDYRMTDVWHYEKTGRVWHDTYPSFPERFATAYLQELIEFVQCVREGGNPAVGGDEARAALAIALAARRSFLEGQAIAV